MTDPKPSECECPLAGYCKQAKRNMSPRLHHLCQRRADYRALFHGLPPTPKLTLNQIEVTGPCRHKGKHVREQDCKRCGMKGKTVDVFVCDKHDREASEIAWWTGQSREDACRTCKDYQPAS
jgi:hypothetical protein